MTRFRSATIVRRSSLRHSLALSTALGVSLGVFVTPALAQTGAYGSFGTVTDITTNNSIIAPPLPTVTPDPAVMTYTAPVAGPPAVQERLDVDLFARNTVIEWGTLNVQAGTTLAFNNGALSGTASKAVLNRVDTGVTTLAGTLTAASNIQVWIVNGNGILVGPGASISTGGLVLSALDLNPANVDAFRTTGAGANYTVRFANALASTSAISSGAGAPATIVTNNGVLALIAPQIDVNANVNQTAGTGTGPTAFAIASDVSLVTRLGGPLSITLNAGTAVSTQNVAGAIVGDRVYALLSAQDGVNALLAVAAPVTNASVNAQGVVVLSGAGLTATAGGDTLNTGTASATPAQTSASLASVAFATPFGGPPAVAPTTGIVTAQTVGGTLTVGAVAAAGDVTLGNAAAGAVTVNGAVSSLDYTVTGSAVTLNDATSARNVALNAGTGALTAAGVLNVSGDYAITAGTFGGTTVFTPTFAGTGNDWSITDTAGGLTLAALTAPGTLTVTTTNGGALTVGGLLTSTDEGVLLNAAAGITLNAGLTATGTGGLLTLTGPVTLGTGVTLATSGAATLAGSVDATTAGAQSLTVNATGLTSFNGRVGATTALDTLTTNTGGGTRINTDAVTTTGAQSYGDAVVLGTGATLTGSGATFAAGLSGASGGTDHDLTLNFSTAQTIDGAVVTGVRNLSVGAPAGGTTLLGTIATSGTQAYADAITLGNAVTLTSSGPGAAGNIVFTGTVDGAAGSLATMTAGTVTFGGVVGGTAAPLSIDTSLAAGTAINANVTTSGAQTYSAATIGTGAITLASSGGAIRFQSTLGGTGGLTVSTAGLTRFGGAVSGLAGLTTNGGGATEINADVATTAAQTYDDDVTLTGGASTMFDAGATAVTFGGTLRSANETQGLIVAAGSTLVLNGDVGTVAGGRLESLVANGATTLGGTGLRTVRTVNDQTYTGLLTLGMTPAIGSGALLSGRQGFFTGAIAGGGNDLSLDFTGATTIRGDTFTAVRNLESGGGGTTTLDNVAGAIVTSGTQTYNDVVLLMGDVSVTSTGTLSAGDIMFNSTVDGASNLIVNSQGTATFGGIVGGATPLNSLTSFADTAINTTAITTTGMQNYTRAVVLGATLPALPTTTVLTSTGAGAITFAATVDAATTEDQGLTVNTGGATTFGGKVGFTTRLASLTTDAGGTTAINGGVVTTENDQGYGDAVTFGADTILTGRNFTHGALNGGGNSLTLRFDNPGTINGSFANFFTFDVDGRQRPTATAPGDVTSGGGVCNAGDTCGGGVFGGAIQLGGTITTGGGQRYGRNVTLFADATLNAGGNVTFGGTVDATTAAGQGLTVNTGGTTTFFGAVGGTAALRDLTNDAGGFTDIRGGLVKTGGNTGVQLYNDQVRLFANTRLEGVRADLGAAGRIIGQGFDLTLDMTGVQVVDGAKITGVRNFDTDGPPFAVSGKTQLAGTFLTSGSQTYRDPVELTAATIAKSSGGGDITFVNTLNGAYALGVETAGITTFGGIVGGTAPLRSVTTDAPGSTVIATTAITTFETQDYNDAVRLGVTGTPLAVVLTSTGTGALGNVTFGSTLATADETQSLTVTAPLATRIAFNGDVGGAAGGGTRLLSLTVNGPTSIGGEGLRTIRTANDQTYNGALTIATTASATAQPGDPRGAVLIGKSGTFTGAIAGAGNDLTLNFTDVTTINSGVFTNVRNLRSGGGGITRLSGTISAGSQTYDDDVELTADTTLVGNLLTPVTGNVTFNGTVDSAMATQFGLTVNSAGTTTFGGLVGGTTQLDFLTTDAPGTTAINTSAIKTVNNQTYDDAVNLGADATLNSANAGTIRFARTVDGARILSVGTGAANPATGTIAFDGLIGGTTALTGLALRAGTVTSVLGSATTIANNRVGTLAAAVGGAFSFDDAAALSIGTVDGLSGVIAPGAVSVRAAGLLTVAQGVTSTLAGVSLTGTGITQLAGATIEAVRAVPAAPAVTTGQILLDGNDGDITLNDNVTTKNTTALAVRIVDAGNVVLGNVSTGVGGTLTLGVAGADNLSGNLTQRAGTVLTAGTLVGSIGGSATLGAVGDPAVVPAASTNANMIGTLGPITANGFSYRSANALAVTGPIDAGAGGLSLQTNTGALALNGNLRAAPSGTVTLISAGAIAQNAGTIVAGTLTGSSVGGTSLTRTGNDIGTLAGFTNVGAGGFDLLDTTGLTITNTVDAGSGPLRIEAATINFPGQTLGSTGNVTLLSSGQIVGATVNGANISITGGPLADIGSANGGALFIGAGTVGLGTGIISGSATLAASGNVTVRRSLSAGTGASATGGGVASIAAISSTTGLVEVRGSSVALGVAEATAASSTMTVRSTSGGITFTQLRGAGTKTVTAATGIGGGTIAGAGGVTLTAAATSPITVASIGAPGAGVAALTINGGSLVTIGAASSSATNLVVTGATSIGQGVPATGALTINGAATSGGAFTSTTTGATDLDAVDSVGALTVTTGAGGALSFTDLTGAGTKTLVSGGGLSGTSIDGAGAVALTAATANPLTITGAIGGVTAVNGLTVNGGSAATFGTANATTTAINSTGAVTIGATTQPGSLTVNGAIVAPSFSSRTSGTTDLDDVTSGGAIGVTTTGAGDVLFGTLSGAGAKTIAAGGGITGAAIQGAGAVTLTAATGSPVTIGAIGTVAAPVAALTIDGGGLVTLGAANSNATNVAVTGATAIGQTIASGALTINGAVTTGSFASTTTGATLLGAITATTGDVGIIAGGTATVGGAVGATGAYRVRGTAVTLGANVTQSARGLVDIVATAGAITAGSGLTLQSNSDGAGSEYLALQASGGLLFGGTTLLGGTAAQRSDIGLIAPTGPVALGIVTGRALGGFDVPRTTIGTLTTAGAITASGAITVQRALALTSTGGVITIGNATVTDAGAGITLTTAPGGGAIGFDRLSAPGATTVNSAAGITGTAIDGAGATRLIAGTASPIVIGSIGTTTAPASLTVSGGSALTLGAAAAAGTTVNVGGAIRIGQAADGAATGALTVNGNIVAGGAFTSTTTGAASLGQTTAGGAIAVTAAAITAGQTNAGAALAMTSAGVLSVTGAQAGGDASFDAGTTATLGQVTAGTTSAISIRALDAAISGTQRAARVTFTNRAPTTQALKLGTGPTGAGFALDQSEINLVQAGQVTFDGGAGNVEIGALAFAAGTGSTRVDVLATGRIDVTGAVTGTGAGRTFRFGGTAATTSDKASVIRVVATADAGGRLLFDTADLDLRGGRIGVGQAGGFLDPIGFGASNGLSVAQVAGGFVSNPNSGLYNATFGGLVYTNLNLVTAKTLTVRYGDYALFQNTGAPGLNAGVTLSGLASPSTPALVVQGPGNTANDFALFGVINGITGPSTAVLGSTTLVFSGTDLANTRVNGCLVGSGSGCLSSVVSQPLLNVFDRSRADVFRSADDLALPFDPLVGTNNEALFSGLGLLDAGVTATECAADTTAPGCEQKKDQGK